MRRSLPRERRILLERFRYAVLARKVGGVGTRCSVVPLTPARSNPRNP
jgi:hypothetical protein